MLNLKQWAKFALNETASYAVRVLNSMGDFGLNTYASHRHDHAVEVVKNVENVLDSFQTPPSRRVRKLAAIAGLLHDLGMANGFIQSHSHGGFGANSGELRANHSILSGVEILAASEFIVKEAAISLDEVYLVAMAAASHSKSNSTLAHFEFRQDPGFCSKDGDFSTFVQKLNAFGQKYGEIIECENPFNAELALKLLQNRRFVEDLTTISYAVAIADSMAHSKDSSDRDCNQNGDRMVVKSAKTVQARKFVVQTTVDSHGLNAGIIESVNIAQYVDAHINDSKVTNNTALSIYVGEQTSSFEPVIVTRDFAHFKFNCYAADRYPEAASSYIEERVGETLRFPYGINRIEVEVRIPYSVENPTPAQNMVFYFFCNSSNGVGRIAGMNKHNDQFKYNGGKILCKDRIHYTFCDLEGRVLPQFIFR